MVLDGYKIKLLQLENDISVNQLANELGVHRSTITRMRSNQYSCSAELANRIAEKFRIPLNEILKEESDGK